MNNLNFLVFLLSMFSISAFASTESRLQCFMNHVPALLSFDQKSQCQRYDVKTDYFALLPGSGGDFRHENRSVIIFSLFDYKIQSISGRNNSDLGTLLRRGVLSDSQIRVTACMQSSINIELSSPIFGQWEHSGQATYGLYPTKISVKFDRAGQVAQLSSLERWYYADHYYKVSKDCRR